jgi:hypothetical protein
MLRCKGATTAERNRKSKTTWCSPRARTDRRGSAGWPAARSERRVGVELAEGSAAGRIQASNHHGSTRGVPAEMLRGSRRSKSYRRRGIEGAEQLTGGVPRVKFRRYTGRGCEWRACKASRR